VVTNYLNRNYLLYFILCVIIYFVFFQHLDSFPIRNWDESLFAVNAYEMTNNHNFIVPYYKNVPDLWNSKPPFQIWVQVLFIKLIGYNELSVRLPSALASSFSALLLFSFFKKRFSLIFALSVFLVFVTSFGVSTFHTGRTGDADALLSFFILSYCICFYKWLFENNSKAIFWFFVFLSCAFLTKSIAALLFIPAVIFITISLKKTSELLKNKWFYIGLILFFISSIGYLLLRESNNQGYINYVLNTDIGRITKTIESHQEPFDFYLNNLFEYRFIWFILVIPGAYLLWKQESLKKIALFLISLLICYFLIISISTTKLEWYDLPLFPILSILSAYCIYVIIKYNNFTNKLKDQSIVLGFIFVLPLYFTFRNSYKSEIKSNEKPLEVMNEYAFKNKNNHSLNKTIFLTSEFDRPLYFYKYLLNNKGLNFQITTSINNLRENDIVIVSQDSLKNLLTDRYDTKIIDSYKSILKFQINNPKN